MVSSIVLVLLNISGRTDIKYFPGIYSKVNSNVHLLSATPSDSEPRGVHLSTSAMEFETT